MTTYSPRRIAILGLGRMGSAMARGLAARAAEPAGTELTGADPDAAARDVFPGQAFASPRDAVAGADVVIVAVKPYLVSDVLSDLGDSFAPRLLLSVAAGVDLATLRAAAPGAEAIVRAMPNTAAAVGCSATAVVAAPGVEPALLAVASQLLSAFGDVFPLARESQMHAFIGCAGSAPAFVYVMAEAIADAAVAEGLPRDVARAAVAKVLEGAGRLLAAEGGSPAEQKDAVGSPGGTTMAGVCALEAAGLRGAAIAAVRATAARSREMEAEA